ncbi:hypothetical protein Syun_019733 [Stephania yunnanensis]|uniref:NAC domain-containing protein n=1 Tax=Stephania yunnanensis TaxID=152371 RepID=A0AAP0IX19_9MAGN
MMNNNNSNIPHHQLPWGLTFNPTDEDLMRYLRAKVDNIQLPFVDPIFEFDVFTQDHPSQLFYLHHKLDTVVAVDNAIDELSTMIHRKVSILSLALMQWRLILDFLICTLTDWNCDEVKEKEIRVDTNCNERVELGARKALVDVQDEKRIDHDRL